MTKISSSFECQNCGYASAKWLGRCPECGGWNSLVEEKRAKGRDLPHDPGESKAVRLGDVEMEAVPRIQTSNAEFDRVLGGGVVPGSLTLLGGEPGVGKSTLLLQIARSLEKRGRRVLYVSAEESVQQIRMRADRLVDGAEQIYVLAESCLETILDSVDAIRPTDLIIDSIQTTFSQELDSPPGSISQVRHLATRFLELAKTRSIPVFLIGHVTKDGNIAGPKALEHIVDVVLYFEGECRQNHRIIRAVKNRFGAANEVGIFEMRSTGLFPARNPCDIFLGGRKSPSPGTAVVCTMEGTRPLLIEIQALVVGTQYGTGRRTATGVDYNRIAVLVAMLEKSLGISVMGCDIYVNAAGGLEIKEPGSDLGILAAILSSFRNRAPAIPRVLAGELSLSGEVRPVTQAAVRVREAAVMGFASCVLPAGNLPLSEPVEGIELIPIKSVIELSDLLFE